MSIPIKRTNKKGVQDGPPDMDPPSPPGTTIGAGKGQKQSSKAKAEEPVTRGEIQAGWFTIFHVLAMASRSDTEFTESEFSDVALSTERLAKRVPVVGLMLRWLGPIALVGQVSMKVRRLLDGVARRKRREDVESANRTYFGSKEGLAGVDGAQQAPQAPGAGIGNTHPPQL